MYLNHRTIGQYHDQKNKNTEDVNHRTIGQYNDQKNKNTEDVMYLIKALIDTLLEVDVSVEDKNIRPFHVKHFIG
jgi:hypothetical protein